MSTKTIHLKAGTATLTSHYDERTDHTVLIVRPDREAAMHFTGQPDQGDTVIGGIVREKGQWAVTAYRDRAHLLDWKSGRPVYFLPKASSQKQAAEWLLSWWGHVFRQPNDQIMRLDPFELSANEKRHIFRR